MRLPDPIANTTTEAYLAYKAGVLAEGDLKPKLYDPYIHLDAWLAYWTGLTQDYPIKNVGKNLFNGNTIDAWLQPNGTPTSSTKDRTSADYIPVTPNTSYVLHGTNSTYLKFTQFDSSKTAVSQQMTTSETSLTATTGPNTTYVRIGWGNADKGATDVILEKGSTATAYEPYSGEPEMLTDEEAYIAYLSGVTDTYPEEFRDPADIRVAAYLRYLISARFGRPEYPVTNEELYLSMQKPPYVPSGEPSSDIELDDTIEAPFLEARLYGDTKQDTFQGLNIFNMNAVYPVGTVKNLGGVDVIFEEDGVIELNGSYNVANVELTGGTNTYKIPIDQTKQYYLRIDFLDGEWYGVGAPGFSYECRYNNGQSVYYRGNSLSRDGVLAKIDISGGVEYLTRLRLYTNYGGGDRVTYRKLKLRVAIYETADPGFYEPYVGLAKSPSPLYPQVANCVAGEQVVRVTKKNILHEIMSGEYTEADSGSTWRFDNGSIYMTRTNDNWQGGAINVCNGDIQRWAGWSSGYDTPIANKPGKYTVSIKRTGEVTTGSSGTSNLGVYAYVFRGQHSVTQQALLDVISDTSAQATITLGEGEILGSMVLYAQYVALDNVKIDIQVEHGEEATEFEPPVWNDYNINLGKNLLNKDTAPILNAYLGQTTGIITEATAYRTTMITCEPNSVYTVSKTGNSPLRVAYTNTENPTVGDTFVAYQRDMTAGAQSLTIYTGPGAHTLLIGYKESGYADTLDSVQVERGTKATEYASYVTPIELHSYGDAQDYIYNDGEDWILHKEIGHLVRDVPVLALNGPQSGASVQSTNGAFQLGSWDWGSDYNDTISRAFLSEDIGTLTTQEVNNNTEANAMPDGTYCHRAGTNDRIYFRNTALIGKTGNEVREIMKQENGGVNFWYPLAEPVETVITDTALIAQLDNLVAGGSEEGITNIKVFPQFPDLPGLLYVEAAKDVE